MATRNEAGNIEQCRQPVAFDHEMVIVDDLGTDDTVKRARVLGAKAILSDTGGSFPENKNLVIQRASGEWILFSLPPTRLSLRAASKSLSTYC